jgi:hypothetical protein
LYLIDEKKLKASGNAFSDPSESFRNLGEKIGPVGKTIVLTVECEDYSGIEKKFELSTIHAVLPQKGIVRSTRQGKF